MSVTPPWFARRERASRTRPPAHRSEDAMAAVMTRVRRRRSHAPRSAPTTAARASPAAAHRPRSRAAAPRAAVPCVGGSSPSWRSRLAGVVVVTAQAGAALGGRPSQPPSAAQPPWRRSTRDGRAPGRLAVVDRAAPRAGRGPAPGGRRARRRPATARRSCRARPSSGGGSATRSPAAARHCGRAAVAAASRRRPSRERYRGASALPFCSADDDKVVDSRPADDGAAVRRRRECLDVRPSVHDLRAGRGAPADRREALGRTRARSTARSSRPGIERAVAGSAIDAGDGRRARAGIEERARARATRSRASAVGLAVLERLRLLDPVSYVRFASVYKGFEDLGDFEREVVRAPEDAPRPSGRNGPLVANLPGCRESLAMTRRVVLSWASAPPVGSQPRISHNM